MSVPHKSANMEIRHLSLCVGVCVRGENRVGVGMRGGWAEIVDECVCVYLFVCLCVCVCVRE